MRQPIVSAIILALGLPTMSYAMDQAVPAAPQAAMPAPQAPKAPDFAAIDKERADFMKSKHERMAKIWATNDPNERQKLIDEDRKAMQAHREKMRSLNGMPDMPARGGYDFDGGDMMPPPMMGRPEGRMMPPRPNMERPPMPQMPPMGHHHGHHGGHHQDVLNRLDRIEKTLNDMAGKKTQ